MRRHEARELADHLDNSHLYIMLKAAKENIKDWNQRSVVNKSLTKGTAWNILAKDFDVNHHYSALAKSNMIMEFGDFLPDNLKPVKQKRILVDTIHQEPDFSCW